MSLLPLLLSVMSELPVHDVFTTSKDENWKINLDTHLQQSH